jgi:hypothetical protein
LEARDFQTLETGLDLNPSKIINQIQISSGGLQSNPTLLGLTLLGLILLGLTLLKSWNTGTQCLSALKQKPLL